MGSMGVVHHGRNYRRLVQNLIQRKVLNLFGSTDVAYADRRGHRHLSPTDITEDPAARAWTESARHRRTGSRTPFTNTGPIRVNWERR